MMNIFMMKQTPKERACKTDSGARLAKKGHSVLCKRNTLKSAWIKQHSPDYTIIALCQFMKVSRSRYYHWLIASKTKREKENEALIEKLKVLFEKGRGTYGTRRLKNRFSEQNIIVSRRRIGRLMVQAGLSCKTKKKFKVTTDSKA